MQNFSIFPREMAASLWRNRGLIIVLVKREVIGRYRGSVMGIAWSFFNPLLMLVIYTFVFSVVFKARWGALNQTTGRAETAKTLMRGVFAPDDRKMRKIGKIAANRGKRRYFDAEIPTSDVYALHFKNNFARSSYA